MESGKIEDMTPKLGERVATAEANIRNLRADILEIKQGVSGLHSDMTALRMDLAARAASREVVDEITDLHRRKTDKSWLAKLGEFGEALHGIGILVAILFSLFAWLAARSSTSLETVQPQLEEMAQRAAAAALKESRK